MSKNSFGQVTPPLFHQLRGGSEINIKHRPDIADSAYQVFIRVNKVCHNCGGMGYFPSSFNSLSLTDSCNYRNQNLNFTYFYNVNVLNSNPILYTNPYTGTNPSEYIFKSCLPAYPPINFTNSSESGIANPILDTFALLRDYWYDTIIFLPEKCGMWQAVNYQGLNNGNVAGAILGNSDYSMGTNKDWTNYYTYAGGIQGWPYDQRGIAQINTLVANSNPYFLSQPTAIFYKGIPSSYQQHGIDPDGDSLVYSSIYLVYHDTVHHLNPQSFWDPFIWQNQITNGNVPPFNPPVDSAQSGLRKIPGYACIPGTGSFPNCTRYDPVYNPFDTDSTFYVNPSSGEVTFTAQSSNQFVHLLLRCDEYRNGVWVGAVSRRVNFFIFDSSYNNPPTFYIDSTNLVNCALDTPFVFYACKNQNLSIPFVVKAITNASYLGVSDNHAVGLPAATISYQNNHTDSVRGTLQWYAGNADTGWHYVQVRVYDSACSVTPYMNEFTYLLKIYITSGLQLATNDTTICAGSSVQLNAVGLGNQVTWTVLSGSVGSLSCTNCAHPIASPNVTSRYIASGALLGLGCVSNDTVTVNVVQDFTLHATDTIVCSKNDLMLKANATGNNTSLQYQWSPTSGIIGGSNNSFVLVMPATINYVVTASDSMACFTHTDTASVIYDSSFNPIYTINKQSICTGDTVNIGIVANGTTTWSPNYHISALQGSNVQVWPDTSVNYMATVSSLVSTCKKDLTIPIKVTALRADAGPDQEIFDGESVVLGGPSMLVGADCKVQWFPDQWLFFNFYKNPKAVPHVSTTYWVMISDETGSCIDRDSVTIRVKCTDIYIPNAFNPESLGNEYTKTFGPRNVSIDLDYFRIYNRWGELVFQTRDVGYRWDGNFNGKPQPVGTYVWMIRGKCPSGEPIEKKGNVTLIR